MSDETTSGSDDDAPKPAARKGSKSNAAKSTAGKSGVSRQASKAKLAEREESGTPRPRSAKAQKADEVQAAGTAKASGLHGDTVAEGGPPPETTFTKGAPKPAASKADEDGTPVEGTSSATVGRAEMNQAAGIGATKTASGRGRRKAEAKADTSE